MSAETGHAPIEGVLVCAYLLGGGFEENCDPTDSDGDYAITGIDGGEYKVEFWPGYKRLNYIAEYYNDREFFETADRIDLDEGETESAISAELETGAQIDGTVTALAGGAPLEEVEVCAYDENTFRCAYTDEEGEYALAGLPAGSYEVEFWAYEGNFIPQFFDNRDRWQEADPIGLALGDVESGVDAALKPGGQIKGVVSAAASGAPLDEVPVCALDAFEAELASCDYTNAAGSYALSRLSSNNYKVVFSLPEYGEEGEEFDDGYTTQFFNSKPTFVAADPLALIAPNTVSGVNARLLRIGEVPTPPASPPGAAAAPIKKVPISKKCRKGFKKKKVKGKQRCVKIHKGKGKGKKRGQASRRLLHDGYLVRIQP